jgi:hypothetical protein
MPVWVQKAVGSAAPMEVPAEWLVKPTAAAAPVTMKLAEKEKPSSVEILAMDDSVFPGLEEKPTKLSKKGKEKDKKGKGKKGKEPAPVADDDDIDSLRGLLD